MKCHNLTPRMTTVFQWGDELGKHFYSNTFGHGRTDTHTHTHTHIYNLRIMN